MKRLVALLLLSFSLGYAAPATEPGSVSSATAVYDGSALVLGGHVLLDHGLGKMSAEEASLQRQESGKEFPFSLIHLQKDVLLKMKNSAELRCQLADLDFTTLTGTLRSEGKEKVIYTDLVEKKGGAVPLRLVGQAIDLEMTKKGHDGKKTDYDISSLLAKEGVIIDYAKAFTLRADHAFYQKLNSEEKSFQGLVTAYPKEGEKSCRLTHEGDIVDAELIHLDLTQSLLTLSHPRGTLSSKLIPEVQQGEVQFQSDELDWDHLKNMLILKGNVWVEEGSLGTLLSKGTVELTQAKQKNKSLLQTVHTTGYTTLEYRQEEQTHKLTTYGPLLLDRAHLSATVESPQTKGKVPEGQQICYEGQEMLLYADHASLEYSILGNAFQPVSLNLKDHVRLLSKDSVNQPRCGLADRLTYSPTTRTLILSANPGKKVFFWDETEGIRISGQEIHILHDPTTQKQTVKGVGNVKFSFSTEESALLKQIFPFYKSANSDE